MSIEPATLDEIEQWRAIHVEYQPVDEDGYPCDKPECQCERPWPCDFARLIRAWDVQRETLMEMAVDRIAVGMLAIPSEVSE